MDNTTIEKVKLALLSMQRYSWEQGVAAQAFLELGDAELTVLMAREAVLRQSEDGRLGSVGSEHAVTDPAASGEAVLFAARATGDPRYQAAADRQLDYLLRRAPCAADGTLFHITTADQIWIDCLYMAPPFLAAAGQPEAAYRQIEGVRRRLWDGGQRLFSHIWDENEQRCARRAFWGVGNGWAAAGMTRVLALLPERMSRQAQKLVGTIRAVLDGCLAHQRPDGLFHDVVDKPDTFVETNLAQMLAYTIYRGVKAGWLEPSYLPRAEQMRAAACAKVDEHGLVQGVCAAPSFDYPGTAPEGQAFFLLMEAAARDWETGSQPAAVQPS